MRMFGLIGLMMALLVVVVLTRKQVGGPGGAGATGAPSSSAPGRGQGPQVLDDYQRQLEQAMQRPRPSASSSSEDQ
jgi:hypothetical protein